MILQRHTYISDFLDVSILIPVDAGRIDIFRKNLLISHQYLKQNGIEVLIIATEDTGGTSVLPEEYPFINWKIVSSGKGPEAERSGQLNLAMQEANNRYILPMDPGTLLLSDIIYQLRYVLYHHPNSFAVVPSPESGNNGGICQSLQQAFCMDHVMLMAERSSIVMAGGFGGFNDACLNNVNLQRRLELIGLQRLTIHLPVCPDPAYQDKRNTSFRLLSETVSLRTIREALYPKQPSPCHTQKKAGLRIAFDWHLDKSAAANNCVLQKLNKYHLKDPNIFKREYGIICLIQIRNERAHIPDVLLHLDTVCDGIVLLDDGSVDGSYEAADSAKLLMKTQIANKGYFDDLNNRNLLLQLAYLFKAEWFFFMDADERFDLRAGDLRKISKMEKIDCVSFRRVHLWNRDDQYRKNIPEGVNGVMHRYRMFRSKGFLQIEAEREIHFRPTPYLLNKYRSSVLLLHYGLIDESTRKKKRDTYLPQDPEGKKQGFAYDFILDEDVELGKLDDLLS
jgi:hypothetical protein